MKSKIFDENIADIDYTWEADLVGISSRTMFAKRAYAISEAYRKRGVKTVLGGIHPSMCPEEALQYCDSVVIGEAEGIWPTLLRDAEDGRLKRLYKVDRLADLKGLSCSYQVLPFTKQIPPGSCSNNKRLSISL